MDKGVKLFKTLSQKRTNRNLEPFALFSSFSMRESMINAPSPNIDLQTDL